MVAFMYLSTLIWPVIAFAAMNIIQQAEAT
jgi:hypothetical protein